MSAVKQRIMGAVSIMTDEDAAAIWNIIKTDYILKRKSWDDIEEVEPDEWDMAMLKEVESNPDCKEFVSKAEAYRQLGLDG